MDPLIKITVKLLVATKEENGVFLAKCPFLNIVSQGDTGEIALTNLKEEINFFFLSCCEEGTLAETIDERTKKKREPFSTKDFVHVEQHYVSIPPDIPVEILKLMADAAVSVP